MEGAYASNIAAGVVQAGYKAAPNRIATKEEDDRHGGGRRLGRHNRYVAADGDNASHSPLYELGGERRQPVVMTIGPTIIDRDILTLDEAGVVKAMLHDRNERRIGHWLRPLSSPITGIGCCARAASGHAATAPPSAAINSRRPMWIAMRPSRAGHAC